MEIQEALRAYRVWGISIVYTFMYTILSLYKYIYTLINVTIYEKIQYTFTHMIV